MDKSSGRNANKSAVTSGGVLDTLTRARIETLSRPVRKIIAPAIPLRAARDPGDLISQERQAIKS
jgi:hypothetical protein